MNTGQVAEWMVYRGIRVLALLLLCFSTGCSSGSRVGLETSPAQPPAAEPAGFDLPAIFDLDGHAQASELTTEIKHKAQGDQYFLKSDNSWVEGDDILFDTAEGELGYVIFRFGEFLPEDTIYEFKTNAWNHDDLDPDNFGYYIAVPDYVSGSWRYSDRLTAEGKTRWPLPGNNYVSPAGYCYIAVLFHDSQQALLSSITTYWDLGERGGTPTDPVDHLGGSLPSTIYAGEIAEFTLEALDSAGAKVDTFNAAGHLSAVPDGMEVLDDAGFADGEAFCQVRFNSPGVYQVSLNSAHPSINGDIGLITVLAPIYHLGGSPPALVQVNQTAQFTLQILDTGNQVVDTFNADGHLSSIPTGMQVVSDAQFVNGEAVCQIRFATPGTYSIQLSNVYSTINGPIGMVAVPDPVHHLGGSLPSSAQVGADISFNLQALDSSNNVVTSFNAAGHLGSSPAGITVLNDAQFTSGVAACRVRFNNTGTYIVVLGNAHANLNGNISSINIIDPVDHLVGSPPDNANIDQTLDFTLQVVDTNGDPVNSFNAQASLSSSPAGVEVLADAHFTNGVADCSIRFAATGTYDVILSNAHPNVNGTIDAVNVIDLANRLPVFEVEIDPDDLDWLIDNPDNTDYLPIGLLIDGVDFTGSGMKLRGASAKYLPKKSWKIRLPDDNQYDHPVWGYHIRSFNINADHPDSSLLRERLSYDVFEDLGALSSRAEHCLLYINDEFYGVYTSVENNRRGWLDEFGYDNNGPLYQGKNCRMYPISDYYAGFEKELRGEEPYTEIQDLVEALDSWSSTEIYDMYNATLDMTQFMKYMVGNTLISQGDHGHKNYYLYYDEFGSGLWSIIPWDHDLTWGRHWNGYDQGWGGLYNPSVKFNTPIWQGDPSRSRSDNQLYKEFLRNTTFAQQYKDAIADALDTVFTEDAMINRINQYYDLIHDWVLLDDQKWGSNSDYDDRIDELREYVVERRAFLYSEVTN